jgi:hypothetical protein
VQIEEKLSGVRASNDNLDDFPTLSQETASVVRSTVTVFLAVLGKTDDFLATGLIACGQSHATIWRIVFDFPYCFVEIYDGRQPKCFA